MKTTRPERYTVSAYLSISGLLNFAVWSLLLLPSYLHQQGWSSQDIGWAVGAYYLASLVFQILAGRIADRYGNLRTALWGTLVGCAGGLLYLAVPWNTGLIFVARILDATGYALIYAGVLLEFMQSVPLHLRGRMIGYFGLPGFIMIGAGPLVAEWFIHRWGFRGIFPAPLASYLLIGVFLWRLPSALRPVPGHHLPFRKTFRDTFPTLKGVLIFSVLFGLCFSSWNSFIAPTVHALGVGAVAYFGLGYAAGAICTRLGLSHRLDTGSRRILGIGTLACYGLALACIPQASQLWHLVFLGIVCGMSHGLYYPSLSSIAAERFHPVHAGQALGLYISASNLGMFIGPPLWGAIADRTGYGFIFAAAGCALIAGTAAFALRELKLWTQSSRGMLGSLQGNGE
jgi:ACS family hexuronate transporter-like MFS transporter